MISSLILTIGLSSLIAWVRLMQGGHFLSDILASAMIMWMTAYLLDQHFVGASYFSSWHEKDLYAQQEPIS